MNPHPLQSPAKESRLPPYEYRQTHHFSIDRLTRARQVSAMLSCVVGAGFLYQTFASLWDRYRYPPPGKIYPVQGGGLHLQVQGSSSPTVILESGLGGMSSAWGWIQPEVARFCRVVAYDRAGLGWSESDAAPFAGQQTVTRLHAALQAAKIPPPYILVGHSMGGLLVRVFNHRYPGEVIGLVLVDACHPEQHLRSKAIGTHMGTGFHFLKKTPILTGIGYVRHARLFRSWSEGLPQRQAAEAESFLCSYRHQKTTKRESLAWEHLCAEVRQTQPLKEIPLAVLTAGKDVLPGQPDLQSELLALSWNSSHTIVGSANHVTLVTNREYAMQVVQAIRRIVDKVCS